jgi:hypothetical protein
MDQDHVQLRIDTIKCKLLSIGVDLMLEQCEVIKEDHTMRIEVSSTNMALDKIATKAEEKMEKQEKAMIKVEKCEKKLARLPAESPAAQRLESIVRKICKKRAKK